MDVSSSRKSEALDLSPYGPPLSHALASACLMSVVYLMETGNGFLLTGTYCAALIVVACFVLFWLRRRRDRLSFAPASPEIILLLFFFCFFVFRILTYPDPDVSYAYARALGFQVFLGAGIGFIAFSASGSHLLESRRAYIAAGVSGMLVLGWISWRFSLTLSEDIFLVQSSRREPAYYQVFGDFLLIFYVCMVVIVVGDEK